jgi:CubicO group peptidase (beta-lactamase class C family)
MYGHTGFTGTSLVIDPESQTAVILLTNSVHLETGNVIRLRSVVSNIVAGAVCRIEE